MSKKDILSFAQYHIDNTDKDFLEKYWDYEKNTVNPFEISYGSNKYVWIRCDKKAYHGSYNIKCKSFSHGGKCSYCCGKNVNYFDSIGFLHHNIAKLIIDDDRNNLNWREIYNISPGSHAKYYVKCLNCGNESNDKKVIYNLTKQGYSCKYCSDGVSIPEKFMGNLLNELNVDYVTQYMFEIDKSKRYDFYIPDMNMIIETNGIQHYKSCNRGRSLLDEKNNDIYKNKLALSNGIDKYISINCSISQLNWLRDNIIKELGEYFNLSNVDWNDIWIKCQNSLTIETWNLWNSGVNSINDISLKLNLNRCVVRDYLKRGKRLGKVDYDEIEIKKQVGLRQSGRNNPRSKSFLCITTKRIFRSGVEAAKYYNINVNGIRNCCKGRSKYSGKLPDGTKLKWKILTWNHNKKYVIKLKPEIINKTRIKFND